MLLWLFKVPWEKKNGASVPIRKGTISEANLGCSSTQFYSGLCKDKNVLLREHMVPNKAHPEWKKLYFRGNQDTDLSRGSLISTTPLWGRFNAPTWILRFRLPLQCKGGRIDASSRWGERNGITEYLHIQIFCLLWEFFSIHLQLWEGGWESTCMHRLSPTYFASI